MILIRLVSAPTSQRLKTRGCVPYHDTPYQPSVSPCFRSAALKTLRRCHTLHHTMCAFAGAAAAALVQTPQHARRMRAAVCASAARDATHLIIPCVHLQQQRQQQTPQQTAQTLRSCRIHAAVCASPAPLPRVPPNLKDASPSQSHRVVKTHTYIHAL